LKDGSGFYYSRYDAPKDGNLLQAVNKYQKVYFHAVGTAQDQDTLVYYYSAAKMVVMPSYYESFGMVALEAMACGTPVVASKVGGLAFSVQDGQTGFLVPHGDAEALAGRIRLLLQDDDLRQRLGRQAAHWAKRFGWPIIADQIIDLYEQVQPAAQTAVRARWG
jgi:D-inositol-3-phosphate glycosyltransferase